MAREIGMDPDIWMDPEFAVLSGDEKLAWFAFIADAEDTPLTSGVPKINRTLALALLQNLVRKGLIHIPPSAS